MANSDHLALLYRGVRAWNQWRMKHWNEQIRPDLSDTNLQGLDLSGANFGLVDFSNTNLRDATLLNTYFLGANLSGAKLLRAKCKGAYFSDANLKGADLSEAWLFSADLSRADLTGACLENAHLGAVRAIDTKFNNANLTGACIEDWQINKSVLDGVKCQYVYLKCREKDRCPSNRDFFDGEFSRRFQISQNILELAFNDGVPWEAFAHAFSEVNSNIKNKYDSELFLYEYKVLGEGLVILKIAYPPEADSDEIRKELESKTSQLRESELKNARLEGELTEKEQSLQRLERLLSSSSHQSQTENPRVYVDNIDTFERIRNIDFSVVSGFLNPQGYLDISEEKVQLGLESILNETFHKKDWGGEYNDLYTSNLVIGGKRKAAAFLLKGNGLKAPTMEIKHCGKNGDQIVRLFESPAELFIVQFVGNISEAIIKDVEGKIEQIGRRGKQSYYCIINGSDTARLLHAYDFL